MSKKNFAHSIFQRLLNRAKTNKEDFNLLLSRYGMERFLYRLSISSHNHRLILKGASLFLVCKGHNYRVTRDADFLGFGSSDVEQLADVFRGICNTVPNGVYMIMDESDDMKTDPHSTRLEPSSAALS